MTFFPETTPDSGTTTRPAARDTPTRRRAGDALERSRTRETRRVNFVRYVASVSTDDHGTCARAFRRKDGVDARAAFISDAHDDGADDADGDDDATGRDDSTGETDANALGDIVPAEKTSDATHATGADDGV